MINPQQNTEYYPALTGIRAVAAYLVFIHHFNPFTEKLAGRTVNYFFGELHTGVTFFFVLSGLLICLKYYDSFDKKLLSFYNYMIKRFARIYPVYFLILTLNFIYYNNTFFFENTPVQNGWFYYIGGITFLKGFFEGHATTFVGQSWSLTVEETFYLLAPLTFILIHRKKQSLYILPAMLIIFGCILVFVFYNNYTGFFKSFRFMFSYTFFGRCIEFFTGIFLALLYKRSVREVKKSAWFTYAGLLNIFICIWLLSTFRNEDHYGDYHPAGIFINNVLLPLSGIALLYWGLLTEKSIIRIFLSTSLLSVLGKSSYAFYLVHVGVFSSLLLNHVSSNFIVLFIFLNLISVAIYNFFELPLEKTIKATFLKKG